MDIKELKEKKEKLCREIADLVVSFQEETELQVISIEVNKMEISSYLCGEGVLTGINVNIEL